MTISSAVLEEAPVETASGLVLGGSPLPAAVRPDPRDGASLAALEAAVLPALLRPPCFVTFSGGTDSSLVLAVATRVARREGLRTPVPFSWRFPDVPAADETSWQDQVLTSLALRDRVVARAGESELDFVGPRAQDVLLRHGVRHPANLHLHALPISLARAGSVLTGAGGDQVLSGWRRPASHTLRRRLKDRVPAALRVAARNLPERELPWLRSTCAARLLRDRMDEEAAEPTTLAARVRWHAGRRELALTLANLQRLGDEDDVVVVSPLAEPGFVHALAHEFGDRPAPRRSALVAALAYDGMPSLVWRTRPKARFGGVFLGEHSRSLVSRWQGEGVDPDVVDVQALRQAWSRWPVPLATAGLLQQVFIAGLEQNPTGPADQTDPEARRT